MLRPATVHPLVLAGAFTLVLLPVTLNYAIFHYDENFYTGGAITMLQSGDWLVPLGENGEPRFQKPPLTYWVVAASFDLLGISPFAARLPFLLLGAAGLLATAGLARSLGLSREGERLAVLLLSGHAQYALASTRSMTDIILTVGLVFSAWGFAAMMVAGREERRWPWLAYCGAGIAIAAKGLMPLVFVAWSVGYFALSGRRHWRVPRRLLHLPSVVAGLAIGVGWHLALVAMHGPGIIDGFIADQTRSHGPTFLPAIQFPLIIAGYTVPFVLWSGGLLVSWLSPANRLRSLAPGGLRVRGYLAGWSVLVAGLFSFASELEEHYVLPAVPFLAVLLADILSQGASDRRDRLFAVSLLLLTAALTVLAAGAVAGARGGSGAVGYAPAMVYLFLAVLVSAAVLWRMLAPSLGLALGCLIIIPTAWAVMAPVAIPGQGEQLAESLDRLGVPTDTEVVFFGSFNAAGRLRVASEGQRPVRRVDHFDRETALAAHYPIVRESDARSLPPESFSWHQGAWFYRSMNVAALLDSALEGRLGAFLDDHREEKLIGIRGE